MNRIKLGFDAFLKVMFGALGLYLILSEIMEYIWDEQPLIYFSLLSILMGTTFGIVNHLDLIFIRKRQDLYFQWERRIHVLFIPATLILGSPYNFILSIGLLSAILTEGQKLNGQALRKSINYWYIITYSTFLAGCILSDFLTTPHIELSTVGSSFVLIVGIVMTAVLIQRVFSSMTELKENQEQLLLLSQEKNWYSDLFSLVSHNLRTPLATMLNILQIEELRKTDFAASPNFSKLYAEANKVLSIADQSLRKNAWLKQKTMKLWDIRDIIARDYPNITLESGVSPAVGKIELSSAESTALTLGLDSAISNSLKYGGKNILIASTETRVKSKVKISIMITDDGIGMDEETLRNYGTAFISKKHNTSGTGLGVYFTMSLMKQLDWTIDVQSSEGKGTTVTFNLFFDLHRLQ